MEPGFGALHRGGQCHHNTGSYPSCTVLSIRCTTPSHEQSGSRPVDAFWVQRCKCALMPVLDQPHSPFGNSRCHGPQARILPSSGPFDWPRLQKQAFILESYPPLISRFRNRARHNPDPVLGSADGNSGWTAGRGIHARCGFRCRTRSTVASGPWRRLDL